MEIKQLKKELGLTNSDIAEFFNLKPYNYATSTAKKRYEDALCRFYEHVKKRWGNIETDEKAGSSDDS